VIDAAGHTLMPGIIVAHTHADYTALPQTETLLGDREYVQLFAARHMEKMLMRGATTARDMGGNAFSLERATEEGLNIGPSIHYLSGAMISQTSGHGQLIDKAMMERLLECFTPAEILKMVTGTGGELLKLNGLRDPYPGALGVVLDGALADLILVAGNPLDDLGTVTDQDNMKIIMKDGMVHKNTRE
jgi:imidazolonepropionase-like amidohydrolase